MTLLALQRRLAVDQDDRSLTIRTRKDFKKFGIDSQAVASSFNVTKGYQKCLRRRRLS